MPVCQISLQIYTKIYSKIYQNLSITRMTALDEKIVDITSPKRFIRSVSRAYYLSSVLCSIVGLSSCMGLPAIIIICSSSMTFLEFQLICASNFQLPSEFVLTDVKRASCCSIDSLRYNISFKCGKRLSFS